MLIEFYDKQRVPHTVQIRIRSGNTDWFEKNVKQLIQKYITGVYDKDTKRRFWVDESKLDDVFQIFDRFGIRYQRGVWRENKKDEQEVTETSYRTKALVM